LTLSTSFLTASIAFLVFSVAAFKSLTEEIKKAKLENAKLLSDIDIKAIDEEKERDLKAAPEKTKNAIEAVKN